MVTFIKLFNVVRALWRSGLSASVLECQKLIMYSVC